MDSIQTILVDGVNVDKAALRAYLAERDAVLLPIWHAAGPLRSYGDSITKGDAVTYPFPTLIGTNYGVSVTNYGINAAETHDCAVPLYNTVIGDTDNVTIAAGINNMRVSGGTAAKLLLFKDSHAALVAYAAIPDSRKKHATDASITYTGSWSSSAIYSPVNSKYSTTQGDTASFTINGSVLYLGMTAIEVGGGVFNVAVDGESKGNFSCAGAGISTTLGQAYGPKLIRIELPEGGRHTVVIAIVSASSATNNVWIDWVAGSEGTAKSKVYVGNITYMSAAGYVTYGGSTAYTDTYNRTIADNCAMLANDGLDVFYVDSNLVIDPATDLADGLHPTQAGYTKIADNFYPTIDGAVAAKIPVANWSSKYTLGNANTALGWSALPSTSLATSNTAMGWQAAYSTTSGDFNCALGYRAMYSNTTGQKNCAFGFGALFTGVTASQSAAYGYQALLLSTGSDNTAVGYRAGDANTTGTNNTFIGNDADGATATTSNAITLGNASIATLRCQVTSITALSDERDKTAIEPLAAGLDFVNRLRPVSFAWNMRDGAKVGIPDTGFIAQDLQQVQSDTGIEIPGLVYDENPEKLEAAYGKLLPALVKAIQELSAKFEAYKAEHPPQGK